MISIRKDEPFSPWKLVQVIIEHDGLKDCFIIYDVKVGWDDVTSIDTFNLIYKGKCWLCIHSRI
jgi:hypothetical protein